MQPWRVLLIILGVFYDLIPLLVPNLYMVKKIVLLLFIGASITAIILGILISPNKPRIMKQKTKLYNKPFLLTTLSWLSIAIFGSLPFMAF